MFKLVVLSALIVVAAAQPSGYALAAAPLAFRTSIISEPGHIAVQEPVLARIGQRIESYPSAVSHVYRSDVHNKAYVRDIVAPVVKTYSAPALQTYTAPIVRSYLPPAQVAVPAPIIKTAQPIAYAAQPAVLAAPAPLLKTYTAPAQLAYSAPASLVREPIVGEANFLKTHAQSGGGVSLSTFESKPAYFGDRLAYSAPLTYSAPYATAW